MERLDSLTDHAFINNPKFAKVTADLPIWVTHQDLADRQVSRVDVGPGGLVISLSTKYTDLSLNPYYLGHELGHIMAATERELWQPNLGLPTMTEQRIWSFQLSPEDRRRTELCAFAVSVVIGDMSSKLLAIAKLASKLFKIEPAALQQEIQDWSVDKIRARLELQLQRVNQ